MFTKNFTNWSLTDVIVPYIFLMVFIGVMRLNERLEKNIKILKTKYLRKYIVICNKILIILTV